MEKVLSVKVSEESVKQFKELAESLRIQQRELLNRMISEFNPDGNPVNSPEDAGIIKKLTEEVQRLSLDNVDKDNENTILRNQLNEKPVQTDQVNPDYIILDTTKEEKELLEAIIFVWGKIKNKTFTPKQYLIDELLIKLISVYPKAEIKVPVEFHEILKAYYGN